jgi:hypothetical protein
MARYPQKADRSPYLDRDEHAAFVASAAARYQPRPLLERLADAVPDVVHTSCPSCGVVWERPLGADLECAACTVGLLHDKIAEAQERISELDESLADAVRDEESARERLEAIEYELRESEERVHRRDARIAQLERALVAAGVPVPVDD